MQLRVRTNPRATRHVLVIAAALSVAAMAAVMILRSDGATAGAGAEGAAAVFGLGRDVVAVTGGGKVSGSLQLPVGYDERDVRFTLRGGSGADQVDVSGRGVEFEFVAPKAGEVQLDATVDGEAGHIRSSTTFTSGSHLDFVGTDLRYRGRVLVDGGRAVMGEALPRGTRIDARRGWVSYRAHASADGGLGGRLEFRGGRFEVNASVDGARVNNEVDVMRSRTEVEEVHLEVEPVAGKQRYVRVNTPDAVAMVKGTAFVVRVEPDASQVNVEEGVVLTWDRFRYYRSKRDLIADRSMRVDALELAVAADALSDALHPGGGAFANAAGVAGAARREAAFLERDTGTIRDVVRRAVEEIPPPRLQGPGRLFDPTAGTGSPVQGPGADGKIDASEAGAQPASTQPESTPGGTQSTSGPGSTTRGDSSGDGPANTRPRPGGTGGGGSGTDPGAGLASPPGRERYELEEFRAAGFDRCLSTHVLWNGTYQETTGRHLCVPRVALSGLFDDVHPYEPLPGFGCYREHAVWRHVAGKPRFCFPAAQSFVDELGVYQPPRAFQGPGVGLARMEPPCSDRHSLVRGLCRPE